MNHRIFSTVLTAVLVGALASGVAVADVHSDSPLPDTDADDEDTLVVELEPDGDATISLNLVYDLESDEQQAAFESLHEDDVAMTELADRFHDRMESVAAAVDGEDEQTVTDAANDVVVGEELGIVSIAVTWDSLASVDDETLIVTEPFASGFQTDTQFVLAGPEDSSIDTVEPEADTTGEENARWNAGSDLDGFEATLTVAGEDADTFGPGFGVTAAVLGLLGITAIVGARIRY